MSNEEIEISRQEIIEIFTNLNRTGKSLGKATLEAVRQHKKNGNPIALMENGEVKIVQPEDIVVPEEQL